MGPVRAPNHGASAPPPGAPAGPRVQEIALAVPPPLYRESDVIYLGSSAFDNPGQLKPTLAHEEGHLYDWNTPDWQVENIALMC